MIRRPLIFGGSWDADPPDPLAPARGVVYGIALGLVAWAVIVAGVAIVFEIAR